MDGLMHLYLVREWGFIEGIYPYFWVRDGIVMLCMVCFPFSVLALDLVESKNEVCVEVCQYPIPRNTTNELNGLAEYHIKRILLPLSVKASLKSHHPLTFTGL
ncbi:uncharacterized protein LY89DRAFT_4702 [Mollisia scopiformis]|uniref:Uncharacterized protein n=1 Tax=Mollisia scopiformis TaxID=149040 RepID=A0A194XUQ1_MOLSC|nr:uncharacterized protein LY89DRAFT_4702 [Mollisia scopiformis]KUJ23866.1 hypothetical protein LY89DRAFT_4702 [Mollisia scopiformis]